jgi:maltooligosyltrehalose trehalohydrolase
VATVEPPQRSRRFQANDYFPRVRRYPIGAEVTDGGVDVRVWAPAHRRVAVVHGPDAERTTALAPERGGYFAGVVPRMGAGSRYGFRLDDDPKTYPDPASRLQPDGAHGLSAVVDPAAFQWTDADWKGVGARGQVIYELHVGTFTSEGTYEAAARELPALRDLGITVIEMMPVAEFPGRFGWGYDGVDLWAPTRLYGTPDDLRSFVDRAHALGLGVILDVVYNHLGPAGNYLKAFAPEYFASDHDNEWGDALNFDGPGSEAVREFFVSNAAYWIDEFHFDGLRLDAAHAIHDESDDHVLAAIGRRAREAARGRSTFIVAEHEAQDTRLVRPATAAGYDLDGVWNDDFHHAARVALTGHNEAYYRDYLGRPQELISALRWGYLYQGQWYRWQRQPRGTPGLDLLAENFVLYLENHDQVANTLRGARLTSLTSPGRLRAMTALMLLAPGTPMLFQGQEFGAASPFLYFADHDGDLAAAVRKGRSQFLTQFPSLAAADAQSALADPASPETFARCKLDRRQARPEVIALHRDLLALRRNDPAFAEQDAERMYGAVLGEHALALRFRVGPGGLGDRLVLLNLGTDLPLSPIPEPLLAPPRGQQWKHLWSSEAIDYGGCGVAQLTADERWLLPGESALVLAAETEAAR